MTSPSYSSPCIAPDTTGQNAYLFGVPSPGQIDAYFIDLTDPSNPQYRHLSTSKGSGWDSQYSLGCYSYIGDSPATNSPVSIFQFGSTTQSIFYPNGTWIENIGSSIDTSVNYPSPKLFAVVGSANNWDWIVAQVSSKPGVTENTGTWRGMRVGSTLISRPQTPIVMGSDLLLTVGAIAPNLNRIEFGNGLLFAIDQSGTSGTVYKATGNKLPEKNITATDSIVGLSKVGSVDMGNTILTPNAFPAVSAFAAVILDKGPGGVISIYTIDPRFSTFKLVQSTVNGQFPPFLTSQAITTLNSKIVVYGGIDKNGQPSNALHIYDIISGVWTGPGLINPPSSGSSTGLGAPVIGGIAAGVVVIILAICFFVYRARKRREDEKIAIRQKELNSIDKSNKDKMIQLLTMENKALSSADNNGQQKSNNESSVTLTESGQNTTSRKSEDARKRSYEQKQPRKSSHSSRRVSTKSIKSISGDGRISLYTNASSIYLVDSPSSLPPTPMVPPAYVGNPNDRFRGIQRHYTTASTPGTPHSIGGKKAAAYKVAVPDEYDDRQPLHRSNTDENTLRQQSSFTAGSTGSPASINISWNGGAVVTERDNSGVGSGQYTSNSNNSTSTSSNNNNSNTNNGSQTKFDAAQSPSAPSSHTTTASASPSSSSGKQKRTKKAPAYPRSKTEPSISSQTGHADYQYDPETYKVEYVEPVVSPRRRQQSSGRSPTTPTMTTSGSTAISPTSSSYPPSPTTSTGGQSPGLASRDSRHFADVFPLPPKSKGSSRSSSRQRQQQEQEQHQISEWHQQQDLIYQEQQKINQGFIPQSPKTPKLGSLPRPIPRDSNQ